MSQLLIVDVQQTFQVSKDLDLTILKLAKKFKGNVVYCYDIISGEGIWPYDMWENMAEAFELGKFNPKIITKEYAFFREIMDTYDNDEFIVALARLMIIHKIYDAREIADCDAYESFNELYEQFGIEPDFESESFYIPQDLIDSLKDNIQNGVTVVGGGINECLKEVCLLLDVLEIKYQVLNEFTY